MHLGKKIAETKSTTQVILLSNMSANYCEITLIDKFVYAPKYMIIFRTLSWKFYQLNNDLVKVFIGTSWQVLQETTAGEYLCLILLRNYLSAMKLKY